MIFSSILASALAFQEKSWVELDQVLNKAESKNWRSLPPDELIIKIGKEFYGKPYVAKTLDGYDGQERCVYTTSGFDCLTYVETVLSLARMVKKGGKSESAFQKNLISLRYRGGILTDYNSRLHYAAEWQLDNQARRNFTSVTKSFSERKFINKPIDFMSKNPRFYPQLSDRIQLNKIKQKESEISSRSWEYVPEVILAQNRKIVKNGDILMFTTTKKGLIFGHLGLATYKNGTLGFSHASTGQKKVVFEPNLVNYLYSSKLVAGVHILRFQP